MFWYRHDRPRVRVGFTDRGGGVSRGDFEGLNLGGAVGDDPAAVSANRAEVASAFGVTPDRLVLMRQVHGSDVHVVDGPWPADVPPGDGVVTTVPGLLLGVLVADCVPVVLVDDTAAVAGAAHAGRQGLVDGVIPATVSAMRDLGATSIRAVVGPSICGRCYEVEPGLRDEAHAIAPAAAAVSWTGTAAIDVAAGVVTQLGDAGIPVTWLPGCTRESARLYSYRRQPRTGRFGGFVMLA